MASSRLLLCNISSPQGRTTIRLEPEFWQALKEIADREHLTIAAIMREIDAKRGNFGRTGACRVYILNYYRSAMIGPGLTDADNSQFHEEFAPPNFRQVQELFHLNNTRVLDQLPLKTATALKQAAQKPLYPTRADQIRWRRG